MPGIPDDISLIDSDDPLEIIIEIDRKIRPVEQINGVFGDGEIDAYVAAMVHACKLFGVQFELPQSRSDSEYTRTKELYLETAAQIDRMKIDLLKQKLDRRRGVQLDETWRSRIHSYTAVIRQIVEQQTNLDERLRQSILDKLNALDAEVSRFKTRSQALADLFIDLCRAVGSGARELEPAVKLIERITRAITRLEASPKTLALPKPEDFDLTEEPEIKET